MGTDNLHKKRKQRSAYSLQRKINKRKPYDIVLVVCEGKKTEQNYLRGLCHELKLNLAKKAQSYVNGLLSEKT